MHHKRRWLLHPDILLSNSSIHTAQRSILAQRILRCLPSPPRQTESRSHRRIDIDLHDDSGGIDGNRGTLIDSSQQTIVDVLSSTLNAANHAAAASAEVSKLALQYRPSIDANADKLSALLSTDVSSKLSAFESELQALQTASADEMDLAPLLAALHDAIDASLHAAEFASRSSAEAVDAMVRFNVQLGHDMSHHLASIPIEGAHLSGIVEGMMQSFTNGVAWGEAAAWQPLAHVIDRKLDEFSWDGGAGSSEGAAAILVVYGIVAYFMGYSTQIGGWEGYKNDIRSRMEDGTLDVKQLAREIGYVHTNLATTASTLTSVDYDAAARLAYQSSKETVSFDSFKARYLRETSTMMAKKNPYAKPVLSPKPSLVSTSVKQDTLKSVDYDAATRLAYQTSNPSIDFDTFQSQYLAQTSAMVAQKHKNRQADDTALPTPPVQEISAESILKQPMVNVLTKAQPSQTTVDSTSKLPPASPLARLLAEELGVELTSIGKGSGKNGKILIEDVRRFQDKMEGARRLMVKNAPYFATANA
ncbi:hypothetical protein ACHAW6_008434 [Cyclotella cf. meneghiniana]